MCQVIVKAIKMYMEWKGLTSIVLSYDGVYPFRNNHSDHAVVTFVEHTSPWAFLIHLETTKCSDEMRAQASEAVLAPRGVNFVETELGLDVSLLVSDGKDIKAFNERATGKDFWHKQKKWKSLYTSHIEKATTCIMGNKKKGKYIDVD